MILSGHQPCYLPGIQLINKIMLSDAFMHVGHCQYSPRSWHSHNFIRTCELIVPVHKGANINETKIDYSKNWRRKHIASIKLAYEGFRYFDYFFWELAELIDMQWDNLGKMNRYLIGWILNVLKIKTKIYDSQHYNIEGVKTNMLVSMCKAVGANTYLSNEGARKVNDNKGYIGWKEEQDMAEEGIVHRWQNFAHPIYGQESTQNLGRLSVIDALFRLGAKQTRELCWNSGGIA